MSLDIVAKTIPHERQAYPTVGNYYWGKPRRKLRKVLHFRISQMDNEDYEKLVLIHELIEEHTARRAGITEEQITAFDLQFEKWRAEGSVRPYAEPGNDPRCPYRYSHQFATRIERLVAKEWGVDWLAYGEKVNSL